MKKACALLLMIALACLSVVNKFVHIEEPKPTFASFSAKDMAVPLPKSSIRPTPEVIETNAEFLDLVNSVEVAYTYVALEYEYIGRYYVTAYCPWECGFNGDNFPRGWNTASGEICHRASDENRLFEPTTCAIDRNYHSFGEFLYIEEFDRVFVTEDTGSAVKGRHIDIFYEDYDEVIYFPSGYYTVYSVQYVTKTSEQKNRCCVWEILGYNKNGCVGVATIQR